MKYVEDYVKFNEKAWNNFVETNYQWTIPVSSEMIELAKNGVWDVVATPTKPVPKSWFPKDFSKIKVLCLAGGGGQQGPIFAALGADVTVFDNCRKQLEKDELVARREGLKIKTIKGDMKDLSALSDETYDLIMQFAGVYVDTVLPVWKEAYRVLKKGGIMIAGHNNPNEFIFDLESMEKGELIVRHKIPYSDLTSITKEEFERVTSNEGVCFGHSLNDLIQGQIDAGFLISGFYEDIGGSPLDEYIPTFFATKAIKL
jgi:SAM-dependent methyltransferase